MTRRGHGSGTIEPAGRRFRVRVRHQGQRIDLGRVDTEGEGEELIAAFWSQLDPDERALGLTLRTWGKAWAKRRPEHASLWRTRIAPSSLADEPLEALEPKQIRRWVREQLETKSPRTGRPPARQTVQNALNTLRQCLEDAVEADELAVNPAHGVRLPRGREQREISYYSAREVRRLLGCLDVPIQARRAYTVAAFMGLRSGELWGLQRGDVDLAGQSVIIRRSWRTPHTKTKRARRLPLMGPAGHAMADQLASHGHHWVFPNPKGGCFAKGYDGRFAQNCERAGVRVLTLRDLRHTAATLLRSGEWGRAWSLDEVQALLGHTSAATTERYYADIGPGVLQRAAARLAPHLAPNGPGPEGPGELSARNLEPATRVELVTYGLRNLTEGSVNTPVSEFLGPLRGHATEVLRAIARGDVHAHDRAVDLAEAVLDALDRLEARARTQVANRSRGGR